MNPNDILKKAKDALDTALAEKKRNGELINGIGPAVVDMLKPILNEISANTKISREVLLQALSEMTINVPQANVPQAHVDVTIPDIKVPAPIVNVTVPEIKLPDIKVPEIKIPKITVPTPIVNFDLSQIKSPDIHYPDEMNVRGWVNFMGYDSRMLNNPLPVQLRDADGNPVKLFENLTTLISQGGGGIGGGVTVMNGAGNPIPVTGSFSASFSGSSLAAVPTNAEGIAYNSDNPMPITGSFTSSPAPQVSGYADSVNLIQVAGIAIAVDSGVTGGGVQRVVHVTDVAMSTVTTGNVASAATDSGNPVKVGGIYNATLPTFTDGQRGDAQLSARGSLRAELTGVGNAQGISGLGDSSDSIAASATSNSLKVINRNTIYDSIGDAWNRAVGGAGVSNTGTMRMVHAADVGVSVTATQTGTWNITTLTSVTNSVAAALVDSSGVAYSGSNPFPVSASLSASAVQVSDGQASTISSHQFNTDFRALDVYIGGSFESTVAQYGSGDNRIKVDGSAVTQPVSGTVTVSSVTASVAAAVVDTNGVAYTTSNPFPMNVSQWNGATPATGLNETGTGVVRVVQMTDSSSSVSATQVGTWNITAVTSVTNSVAAALVDSSGVAYSGSNPFPVSASLSASAVQVSDGQASTITSHQFNTDFRALDVYVGGTFGTTVADAFSGDGRLKVDASASITADYGSGEVGTNTLRVVAATDSIRSTQAKYIARQTNPTAVADAASVFGTADDIGRQITRPIQARDLIATAYTTLSTGTEATILTAGAGTYLDCIWMAFANTSGVAVQVDIRGVSGGNILNTIEVPASGTAGWAPPVPWPQDATGNAWTADMADVTGTTVYITSLFSKEV